MSRRPRPLALPWVLLCLLAYLGSAAHFVLVQHRTCLEHGELVHEDGVAQAETPAKVRVSFADKRVTGSEAPASAHGVDAHCAHAFLRRAMPPPAYAMSELRAPVPEGPVLVVVREVVEPPVAWLRLAPKASPPRV
jgi:hypothetical protein